MTKPRSKALAPALFPLMKFSHPVLFGTAAIVLGTILVYLPAIFAGFIWDDPEHIINNHTLRTFGGLYEMWTSPRSLPQWYPLVHTTFWIEYHLWGLAPMGYHINNVLLHITSALLLWRVLKILEVPGAWLAAAIFAMHPVHVESVAWVTERKNVLSGVFYLLSLLSYLEFLNHPSRRKPYVISLLLFVAALLSKSVTATLPAAILVILWWKHGSIRRVDVVRLVPFFVIGAAMGLFTAYLEMHHVGASGERIAELNLSPFDRVLIAGRAIWFYARKLVTPWPLVFIYPQWKNIDPSVWWQWAFPIGVVLALVALVLYRKRIGRGPAAAAMLFCGTLFPALGFVNVYPMRFSYVADHFQYHASMALIALIAALLWRLAGVYGRLVLIPLGALTLLQTPMYSDAETLWRNTLARNQESWMVHTNLGKVLVTRGEATNDESALAQADEQYRMALELAPDIHDTHTNYGMSLGRRGRAEEALAHFRKAIEINPTFAPAYYGMGQVYQKMDDLDRAAESYLKAIELAPQYPQANFRLGLVLERRGDLAGAANRYRTALEMAPEDAVTRYNLGRVLISLRHFGEAVYNLQEAVRIRPNWAEAWTNLGAAHLLGGHKIEAAAAFQRALSIDSNLTPARLGLQRATQR